MGQIKFIPLAADTGEPRKGATFTPMRYPDHEHLDLIHQRLNALYNIYAGMALTRRGTQRQLRILVAIAGIATGVWLSLFVLLVTLYLS